MRAAVDVGNTHLVLGLLASETTILHELRIRTDRQKTAQEYQIQFDAFLAQKGYTAEAFEATILSSVVASLRPVLKQALEQTFQAPCYVVSPELETGLVLDMDQPQTVGSDLIVDAVGALSRYQPPIAIFDLGTATTLSVIDDQGHYIGGCICPGVRLSVDALSGATSSLPYIDLSQAPSVIAKNTVACMQAGVLQGHAALLDGLLERAETQLGYPLKAVATGGLVDKILPYCRRSIDRWPQMTLVGLAHLLQKQIAQLNATPCPPDAPVAEGQKEGLNAPKTAPLLGSLRTSRVELRPYRPSDQAEIEPIFEDEATLYYYLPGRLKTYSGEALTTLLADWNDQVSGQLYCIKALKTDRLIGLLNLDDWDEDNAQVELGLVLAASVRRQGYATEVVKAVIEALWHRDIHRIRVRIHEGNEPSMNLFKRLGFQLEGCFKQAVKRGDRYLDQAVLALLRPDPIPQGEQEAQGQKRTDTYGKDDQL